ncbi:uncharacterized protein DUF4271 [Dysgonomonas alginatilytica]|uniref:Uncharacterized protein DUF4271 n=1 Tax=Dysgonomonas alginatilytica TaxID=1605892 RepID=A0A2V3PVE8_9BACT|nr:DUF4271 domain-containing protein [Dysgonomonas alginatilytica]PXV68876.1 uncharacterized protein DUF4271 [Dysgonomonas alginatilytica]
MNTEATTYYVIDSLRIAESCKDSVDHRALFAFEKDTSLFFTKDKLEARYGTAVQTQMGGGHEGVGKIFTLEQDDGVLALLVLCFLFFTRVFKGGFTFFKENARLLFSTRENLNLFSETTVTEFWFNFILIFQTILLGAIVIFDVFLESDAYKVPQHSFYTIILFMLTIWVFFFLKYLLYRVLGYLFDIRDRVKIWLRSCTIVFSMIGIIAFIPTLMMVYSQNFHDFLLIFFLGLFIISQLILFYRVITFFLQGNVNFFFLIAYLCGVEIIPYIILYQVLIYLYKVDLIGLLWL